MLFLNSIYHMHSILFFIVFGQEVLFSLLFFCLFFIYFFFGFQSVFITTYSLTKKKNYNLSFSSVIDCGCWCVRFTS